MNPEHALNHTHYRTYLHSCKPVVIHGDLKGVRDFLFFHGSSLICFSQVNILVNGQGQALITDFGLAKVRESMNEVLEHFSSNVNGSLRWMAPELVQVEDDQKIWITTFTDVYAFASVCLEVN